MSSIIVRVFASGPFLLFCPSEAKKTRDFYPTNNRGNLGCVLINSKKQLQVSEEALKLMEKIQLNGGSLGDISWWKCEDKTCAFSWFGAIFRIMDYKDCEGDRDFRIHRDHCTIIPNDLTKEMKLAVRIKKKMRLEWRKGLITDRQYSDFCFWKEPFCLEK
jgi:hypothetical protein